MRVQSLNQEDPLEKEMETHSSILAWGIAWAEEPGGLQSMGLQTVRRAGPDGDEADQHDLSEEPGGIQAPRLLLQPSL